MPSASSKPQASQPSNPLDVLQEPVKSACSVADKKLRNLEKRRLKLLETKKKADKGEKLNEDQKNALKSLESVDFGLETVKDIQKNLSSLEQEYSKLLKKDQKRQKLEQKDKFENQVRQSVINVVEIQAILGELSEEVRPDFLAGTNGACQLTESDFENLDSVYELINPAASEEKEKKLSERVKVAGQHLANLVEGKASAFVEEVTYKEINELLQKIKDSGYFDKEDVNGDPAGEEEEEVPEETPVEEEQKPLDTPAPVEIPAELESPEEESPVADEPTVDSTANTPVNGVDLPPVVQETPEEEGFKFMGESEISTAVQEAPLNPVSPEFVPRKMQPQQEEGGFENSEGNDSNWQQIEGGHGGHQGNYRGRGGRGRGGRGRGGSGGRGGGGNYRGNQRDGNYRGRGGSGNYRGNREGGSGNYRGNRDGGSGNYRGNREGGRGSYRGGQRDGQGSGNRGHPSRGGGQHQQQQQA